MQKEFTKIVQTLGLSLVLLFSSCQSKSQESAKVVENINKNEITWNPSIDDALAQAKASGKLLFVECYSPTCPVCISLEPFFKKTEVATAYNSNFVNYKLDVGKADQVKFLNAKNIFLPSFPQFLFFDGDGNIVHQGEVTADIKSFLNTAETAQNTEKRAENFKKKFANGDRSLELLVSLASYARVTKDTVSNLAAANELFNIYPKNEIGSETSWKLTKKCVTDIDNGFAKYWFDHMAVAAAFEKKDGHADNDKNIMGGIIQSSLYSPKGRAYNTDKIALIKQYMAKAGAGEYADGVTWEFETNACMREGKLPRALAIGEKTALKYGANGQSLVYIVKVFNDAYPDKTYATKAKAWLVKAKPLLKEDKFLAEYFYESARLNKKAGDAATAKADAQQAIGFATKASVDLAKFNALASSI
jgi:thioredoxin-related protein